MSVIPPNLARVPNLLTTSGSLAALTRTNIGLYRVQAQLATGRAIINPSDDAVRASTISALDDRLERAEQRLRNFDLAGSSLDTIDAALGEANEVLLEAKSIALTEVSFGRTAEERRGAAVVVSSLIDSAYAISNRQSPLGWVFGGSSTSSAPMDAFLGGYRYRGQGPGLLTDLGSELEIPVTLGSGNVMGSTSERVRGSVDLAPMLTDDTRLEDLSGARGVGITLGTVQFSFNGGAVASVDLSGADTAGDIIDRLESAIHAYEQEHEVTILGAGGVSATDECFSFDVVPGSPDPELEFTDVGNNITARDLGLTDVPAFAFSRSAVNGISLDPKLAWTTPVAALAGVTGALGAITLANAGQTRSIDLSGAETVQDIKNAIEGAGLGVRVELNHARNGIDVFSEVAGGRDQGMWIAEVVGSDETAARLGIRSMGLDTRIDSFNDGRGVQIVDGSVDPITGEPDPDRDIDFAIVLGDSAGTTIEVDLRPQDMVTVQTVLDRINAAAADAGLTVPDDFQARLALERNGLVFTQSGSFTSPIRVEPRNNSPAYSGLGLSEGSYDAGSASFTGMDRAKVRVTGVLTALIDLRDALAADDTHGIELAAGDLDEMLSRAAETRALVGSYAQQAEEATARLEDRMVLDEKTRTEIRDLDYTEAAVRFSLLQTQLEAGLRSASQLNQLTLLDFLG